MLRTTLLACTFLAALAPWAAAKTIRAKAAEPVVEELMHGCSLKCAVQWKVEIELPGGKPQAVTTLNDESPRQGWTLPAGANPEGLRLRCVFPKKLPAELEGEIPLYGLNLINGRWEPEEEWKAWARLKRARLWFRNQVLAEITFPDTRRWAKAILPDLMLESGDSLTIEVLEVYPGTQHGLALTEIVLEGAH